MQGAKWRIVKIKSMSKKSKEFAMTSNQTNKIAFASFVSSWSICNRQPERNKAGLFHFFIRSRPAI